ncbi:MAG: hypothetical protein WD844_10260 [Thermoleophilaceae bacterium]
MGRRSRKRMALEDPGAPGMTREQRDEARRRRAREGVAAPAPRRGRSGTADRPPAPWGNFPLSELCVLLAMILGVLGVIVWGERGQVMLLAAMALGSLAGLELSIREHLAGYRSHSALLAGAAAIAVSTIVLITVGPAIGLAVAAAVFAAGFYGFRQLFKLRSGGLGFR